MSASAPFFFGAVVPVVDDAVAVDRLASVNVFPAVGGRLANCPDGVGFESLGDDEGGGGGVVDESSSAMADGGSVMETSAGGMGPASIGRQGDTLPPAPAATTVALELRWRLVVLLFATGVGVDGAVEAEGAAAVVVAVAVAVVAVVETPGEKFKVGSGGPCFNFLLGFSDAAARRLVPSCTASASSSSRSEKTVVSRGVIVSHGATYGGVSFTMGWYSSVYC